MNSTKQTEEVEEHLNQFERNFYLINGIVGAALNSAVLLIGLLHVDTVDKPRQIIVISMTFADLLTCIFYMLTRPYNCLCLLWINADKLIFIGRPLHYYQLVKRERVLLLVAFSWATLSGLVITLYAFMEVKHPCDRVTLSPRSYLFICLLYVLTITVSFIVSAIIYCIARNSGRAGTKAARSRLFKRLFFVFSSTAWTFATCLPYRLLYLGNALLNEDRMPSALFSSMINTFYYVLVIGIVVNPLITIITQRLYRHWLARYWWHMAAWFGLGQTQRRSSSYAEHTLVSSDRRRSELNNSTTSDSAADNDGTVPKSTPPFKNTVFKENDGRTVGTLRPTDDQQLSTVIEEEDITPNSTDVN
uniref:G-protein coupled receptors family 1 profile domain-containing protein n=1 Tax=Globodera rostochiensis TaxID=31243 RepID=A0A914GVP5_GLORO